MAASPTLRRVVVSALLLLVVGIGVHSVYKHVHWDHFGVVEPGHIYRSGQLRPHQLHAAADCYQIRSVLNLNYSADGPEAEEALAEEQQCRELGLIYFKVGWPGDGVVDEAKLRWAHQIITDPANQPVLVHCARGTSRTGAVTAYYRILNSNWSRGQILDEMKHYGHRPQRNQALEAQTDRLFQSHQIAAQIRAAHRS